MAPDRLPSRSQPLAAPARFDRGSAARSLWAAQRRLARRERELRIGFTRITQRQVELELLLTAFRRSMEK
jgi:hypothetical protein